MSKYKFTEQMGEISGFSASYEDSCRNMVIAGAEWLDQNPTTLVEGDSEGMVALKNVLLEASGNDCTGAMMIACINHVMYIKEHGWDKYEKDMEKAALAQAEEDKELALQEGTCELKSEFEQELQKLLNRTCQENASNTPDYILADYICNVLKAFTYAVRDRDSFHDFKPFNKHTLAEGPTLDSEATAEMLGKTCCDHNH